MSLISRLLRTTPDPREAVRPLWHAVVALAREERWYAQLGIADTVSGRFDAVTLVLALVMLRMERDAPDDARAPLVQAAARLTELFVEDMDGQLRQSGVGDLVVGKRMGKLVSALGGRIGALRTALAEPDDSALAQTLERNMTLLPDSDTTPLAQAVRALNARFQALDDAAVLSGEIAA